MSQDDGSAADDFVELKNGTRIADRYRLGDLIEQSDGLVTFEAIDEQNGFDVRVRFRPEATTPDERLRDAGIPQYEDHGCIGAWVGSVLDPGAGRPLADALRELETEGVPLQELVFLGTDLLATLDALHAHGMVHGNLGIHSLFLRTDWGVRVIDFPEEADLSLLPEATPFASPERHLGKAADDRSDLYAVAGLLYSLGTGQPPFGVAPHLARDGHLNRDLAEHDALPDGIYEVLARAMAKEPDDRFTTAGEMLEALQEAYNGIAPVADLSDEEPFDTMGPPLVRTAEPVWEEEGVFADPTSESDARGPSMILPAMLLGMLVLTVGGLALGGVTLAGGMWWATTSGPLAQLVDSPSEAMAQIDEADEPLLTMPTTMAAAPMAAAPMAADAAGAASMAAAPMAADAAGASVAADAAGASVAADAAGAASMAADAAGSVEALVEPGVPGVAGEAVRVPVSFGYDSYEAVPEADWPQFVDAVIDHRGPVRLVGHTDNVGSTEANRLMGLGRAWSVSVLMAANGIRGGRIEVETAGHADPIAPNETAAGRAANRRVTAELRQEPRLSDMLVPAE